MTISDTIREAALYADDPFCEMAGSAFYACILNCEQWELMRHMEDADLRTFLLFVAEALEP